MLGKTKVWAWDLFFSVMTILFFFCGSVREAMKVSRSFFENLSRSRNFGRFEKFWPSTEDTQRISAFFSSRTTKFRVRVPPPPHLDPIGSYLGGILSSIFSFDEKSVRFLIGSGA